MLSDPYAVLGLDGSATAAQIRSAFRARARVLHPDVSDDPSSAALFQELVSAVEAIQAGAKFSKATNVPQVETPPGLTPDQRVAWLVSRNKVILFMLGTKQQPLDVGSAMAGMLRERALAAAEQGHAALPVLEAAQRREAQEEDEGELKLAEQRPLLAIAGDGPERERLLADRALHPQQHVGPRVERDDLDDG